jgi:signal transduction histidine kinase
MVEISVKDTGVGLSKKNLAKLFTKFGRIGDSYETVAQTTSTGLGLYITKNYVEKMGGRIWVDSVLGKGTTFTFSLPIAQGAKETDAAPVSPFLPKKILR